MAASSSMMRMRGEGGVLRRRTGTLVGELQEFQACIDVLAYRRCRSLRGVRAGNSRRKVVPVAYFGLDHYFAGVLLHDAVGDGKAEACAFVLALLGFDLGGEEGVVDAVEVLALDTLRRCR